MSRPIAPPAQDVEIQNLYSFYNCHAGGDAERSAASPMTAWLNIEH